jgi:hypothetical protein
VIIWAIWITRNDFIFNKPKKTLIFAGYPYGYPLNSFVVLSLTRGAVGGDGFWVQSFGDGSSGYIQPARLAVT